MPDKMHCFYLFGRVQAYSGNKNDILFLSWHNPVYGSSACEILMRLGSLEGKSVSCYVKELQLYIFVDKLFQLLTC